MQHYFVADTNIKARRMTLRDDAGCLHVATVPFEVPPIGDVLTGSLPGFGPHALVGPDGGVLRVCFDLVNCGQRAALEELHGQWVP